MRGRDLLALSAVVVLTAAGCSVERDDATRSSADDHPGAETGSPPPRAGDEVDQENSGAPGAPPRFVGAISRIGRAERRELVPRNWRPGCPVPLEDLRWLTVSHWTFGGEVATGRLVVHERVAEDVLWVFRRLYRARFPIHRLDLPPRYRPERDRWDDRRNLSAAFNCRPVVENPGSWSQHAYGWAIDLNPVQNPYVRGDGTVLRRIAKRYGDRSLDRPGMIHDGDIVVRLFARIGWQWGGHWRSIKDYMHFSLTGG